MNINPDFLGALLTIASTLLLAFLAVLVRVVVRFSQAESHIEAISSDMKDFSQATLERFREEQDANIKARSSILEIINGQDKRLRFMEEYWIKAGLRTWPGQD